MISSNVGKWTLFGVSFAAVISTYLMILNTDMEDHNSIQTGGMPGERFYTMPSKIPGKESLKFNLLDPETAPEIQLNKIVYGYQILIDTKQNAPDYTGNELNCRSCHFDGGNALGGRNRGISLVGVTAKYPHFSSRVNRKISLSKRVNMCFEYSMNGKPLPIDSFEMEAILAYLAWISLEVMNAPELPWLGLQKIQSEHIPDKKNGKIVYERYCALCHGNHGEGSSGVPPVWGPQSYNAQAGMNRPAIFASFVYLNMPYGQPFLSEEEALDVAAYVVKQPRPRKTQAE